MPKQPGKWYPQLAGMVPGPVDEAHRVALDYIYALRQKLNDAIATIPEPGPTIAQIKAELQSGGSNQLNVQGLQGVLSQPQAAAAATTTNVPFVTALPASGSPLAFDGSVVDKFGVLFRYNSATSAWSPLNAVSLSDTHTNRPNYPATNYPDGTSYFETDRKLLYVSYSGAWYYHSGIVALLQGNIAGFASGAGGNAPALGAGDGGLLIQVTDYGHILQWGGSSWQWGPGDDGRAGEGPIWREVDPSPTTGYHLYDGTVGVAYLKSDGTTGTVTLPNLSGAAATSAYVKSGSTNGAVVAATLPTFSGNAVNSSLVSGGTSAGTIAWPGGVPTFAGSALPAHQHQEQFAGDGSFIYTIAGSAGSLASVVAKWPWISATGTISGGAYFTSSVSGGTAAGTIAWPGGVPTFAGSSLATHQHSTTATGTISLAGGDPVQSITRRAWFRQ